jgi:hypothetical protein
MRCISSVLFGAIAALPLALAGGCAHFSPPPSQIVKLAARVADGSAVTDAVCTVSGVRGTWTVVTPGEVRVPTTQAEMTVACAKEGLPNGYARIVPADAEISWRGIRQVGGIAQHLDPVLYPPIRFPLSVTVVMGGTVVATTRPTPP